MSHVWGYSGTGPAQGAPWAPPAQARATTLDILETAAAAVILLLMSQALLGRIGDPEQTGAGASWLRMMWLPCYGVILMLVAARTPRMISVWPAAPLMLALVAWAFITREWSLDPDATFRRALALSFATLFGMWLAVRFSWRQLIEIVALVSLILAVGSLIAVLVNPTFGKMQDVYVGSWRGLWFEKNAMGGYMARGTLACLCAGILNPQRRLIWLGGSALCFLLVITSTSTTALLAALLAVCGVCGLAFLRRGPVWAVVGLWLFVVICAIAATVFLLAPDIFFSAVGKDSTLTGRTGLWEALGRQMARRPWGGWGYGGFWQDKGGPADLVRRDVQWNTHNADNAWLQIRIETGWVGAALVAAAMSAYTAVALWRLWKGPEAYWTVMFIALLALNSISESMLARPNDMTWVVFVATFSKLFQLRSRNAEPCPR